MNKFTNEYEFSITKFEENIQDTDKRFIHIMNYMRIRDKVFQNEDQVIKVLRCIN